MATKPQQGSASALPTFELSATVGQKVVRLPTAPRRKVQQPQNKAGREARLHLRACQRRRFEYVFPGIRAARKRLEDLRAMPATPAVILVRSLIEAPNTDDRARVLAVLRFGESRGDTLACDALNLLRDVAGRTYGEQNNFREALARLDWADQMDGRA